MVYYTTLRKNRALSQNMHDGVITAFMEFANIELAVTREYSYYDLKVVFNNPGCTLVYFPPSMLGCFIPGKSA